MDAELLAILACPRCLGELAVKGPQENPEGLACAACAVVYPVTDGIPVLLVEEAVSQAEWEERKR